MRFKSWSSRIRKSHKELFFKIGFLQLQFKSLKNSCARVHFLVKLQAVVLLTLRNMNFVTDFFQGFGPQV